MAVLGGERVQFASWGLSGKDARVRGLAAPSNLSMNQNLEGHSGKSAKCLLILSDK